MVFCVRYRLLDDWRILEFHVPVTTPNFQVPCNVYTESAYYKWFVTDLNTDKRAVRISEQLGGWTQLVLLLPFPYSPYS